MSKVTNSETCGAVNAELTIAAAVCLRTPRIGIRISGEDSAVDRGARCVSAADRTSSCVIVVAGPVGVTVARSTPRSFANFRTGGVQRIGTAASMGAVVAGSIGAVAGAA